MNLNPVQDGHFWGCSRMGPFLGHISYNDETWHSYTLPREDQKKYESRDTSISDISIFSPEISKFCTSVTVTKSRIFKILNLTKKSDRNFRGTFLKNHFRHLKLYSNPPGVVVIWAPFERQKIEVHIFERPSLSGYGTWNSPPKKT